MSTDDTARLQAFCTARGDWLLETTSALAGLESPTPDKPAVDRCGRELARRLGALGAAVDSVESTATGNHLRAAFGL